MTSMTSAEKDKLRKCQPLLIAKLAATDGILPKDDAAKVFGALALEQAKADGVIREVEIIRRDMSLKEPDRRIRAVHLPMWDKSKPIWLA